MEQKEVKLESRRITDLKAYENNPRVNDNAVDAIAESIRRFGFKNPVIVDKEGCIICGHTRVKAAAKLGMETVPVIVAYDLTPAQAKAFRLVDNKTAELSDWDYGKLGDELAELVNGMGVDMDSLGFDTSFLNVGEAESEEDEEPEGSEAPAKPSPAPVEINLHTFTVQLNDAQMKIVQTAIDDCMKTQSLNIGAAIAKISAHWMDK